MKIISKVKDYYDYVAGMYGGGDPMCIYDRSPITIKPTLVLDSARDGCMWKAIQSSSVDSPTLRWLCVCGKRYLLVGTYINMGTILNEHDHPGVWESVFDKRRWYSAVTPEQCIGYECNTTRLLSKELQEPVFVIGGCERVGSDWVYKIEPKIPLLSSTKIASMIKAEQMYQEIAYYISNVLPERSDITPPVEVDDKNKIVQAGFDLKTSFRHRR